MVSIDCIVLFISLLINVSHATPECFSHQSLRPPIEGDCHQIAMDILFQPLSGRVFHFISGRARSPLQYELPRKIGHPKYPGCQIVIDARIKNQEEGLKLSEVADAAIRVMNTCMHGEYDRGTAGREDVLPGGIVYVTLTRPSTLLFSNNTASQFESWHNATTDLDTA